MAQCAYTGLFCPTPGIFACLKEKKDPAVAGSSIIFSGADAIPTALSFEIAAFSLGIRYRHKDHRRGDRRAGYAGLVAASSGATRP
jgi:hypothetical protein